MPLVRVELKLIAFMFTFILFMMMVFSGVGAGLPSPDTGASKPLVALAGNSGEEVEIDLDALEEEAPAGGSTGALVPDEPMLPVTVTEQELNRCPWLALFALLAALPVVLMLVPPKRARRRRIGSPGENTDVLKEA